MLSYVRIFALRYTEAQRSKPSGGNSNGFIVIRLRLRKSSWWSEQHHESTCVQRRADLAHRWGSHARDVCREHHLQHAPERLVVPRLLRSRLAWGALVLNIGQLVRELHRLPLGDFRHWGHRRAVHSPVRTGGCDAGRTHHPLRVLGHRLRRRRLPEERRELGWLPAHRTHHPHLR